MEYGASDKLTCLYQEKQVNSFRISVSKHEREVESFRRVLEVLISAQGDALREIASQRRPNTNRLCSISGCQGNYSEPEYPTLSASRSALSQSPLRAIRSERLA